MISALDRQLMRASSTIASLQSDEIESLLKLLESEFPSWVELESEEKAGEGYTACWEADHQLSPVSRV
jgi:hypothetical protein